MVNLNDKPSILCYIAPYCEILKHLDFNIDEERLFVTMGGIDFKYTYIHNNHQVENMVEMRDGISLEGSRDISLEIQHFFGVEFYEIYSNDKNELLTFCRSQIEIDKPIIIFLDVYFLSYHPQYNKIHGQTSVLLYGISEDKNRYYIYDKHVTTIPISVYYGSISSEEIENALIYGWNTFNGKEMGVISYERKNKSNSIDVLEQLQNMSTRMLDTKYICKGIEGIRYLGKDILRWDILWNEKYLKQVCNEAYVHIVGRGGPYISRLVLVRFLRQERICTDKQNKENDKIVSLWHSLAVGFFKIALRKQWGDLKRMSDIVMEIGLREEDMYYMLLDIYSRQRR